MTKDKHTKFYTKTIIYSSSLYFGNYNLVIDPLLKKEDQRFDHKKSTR